MNTFFLKLQKNQFYVLIPLVLLLGYSLAYIVRMGVILFLPQAAIPKIVRGTQVLTQGAAPKAMNSYEETVTGNMIRGVLPGADVVAGGADGGKQTVVIAEEIPGADDILVTGTLSGSQSFARATFKPKDKEDGDEFSIGQKVAGYLVKGIYNHYVVLFKNGVHCKVEIGETIGEGKKKCITEKKPEEATASVAGAPNPDGCPVTKKIISRTDFERTLKNPNDIYKDARFGPNLTDGKIDGYKLHQVPANHIFYALGARNGDIVRRVNGMPLAETEKMLELWSSIKNASKVTVDLDRKGKCLSYEFTVRN